LELSVYNSSLNFDGTDDYVDVPDNDLLDVGTQSESFAFWFKPTSAATGQRIIHKGNPYNGGGVGYSVLYRGDLGGKPMELQFNDGSDNCPGPNAANVGDLTNTWHHVVVVLDRAAGTSYYLDGALVGSNTSSNGCSGNANSADHLLLGTNVGDGLVGDLDDVRIYNYALTATQIRTLYNENSAVRFGPLTGSP
jgi:hypothetical protein